METTERRLNLRRDPDPLAALELVHALLFKTTDVLTQEEKNTSSTGKTCVSPHTDTALTPTDTPPPTVSAVSAPPVHALTQENAVQDGNITPGVSTSVHLGDKSIWSALLSRVDTLAEELHRLEAPIVRLDVGGVARGYQSIEGLDLEPPQGPEVVHAR